MTDELREAIERLGHLLPKNPHAELHLAFDNEERFNWVASRPGAKKAAAVYSRPAGAPYAIEWVNAEIGHLRVTAARRRDATAEEIAALDARGAVPETARQLVVA